MKILHITNNYPTLNYPVFGIFVKEQIESLQSQRAETEVFFINGKEGGKFHYFKAIFNLRRHLKRNNYDVIHCHHSFSALILVLSGGVFNSKCVMSYQNAPVKEGGTLLFKVLIALFDVIILKNKSPEIIHKKTVYLPNGVNTEFFTPHDRIICKDKLGLDRQKRYILFFSSNNVRPQKRIDRFNQVIEILNNRFQFKNIEPLILTNTRRDLMPYYIVASDLHVLTSDFEGSPNSVKECLACNTPVVSTPVGNVKEIMSDVAGCFISNTFEADELAILSRDALEFNGFSSREKIFEKGLDINSVAQNLMCIYKKLINKN
jgi:glycosyltransferase involved in cell wall biosynthesis